jgi:hypothetical protein
MNPQLQEAIDALEKADAAGNVEDARELANYIRQLQAQEESSSADMTYPVSGAAIGAATGAVTGPAVGAAIDTAATKVAEKVAGPKGTPRGDKVAKWLATQTTGPNVGGATFEEAYKKSEIARGKPVQSRGSQVPIRKGFLGIENQPAEPSLPQKTAANIISSERLGKPSVPRRVGGMGVMGAEAGKTISDVQEGNYGDAAISALGTIGGALSQSRIKPLRAIGTGLSLLVPTVQGGKEVKEIFYPPKQEEEKAAGGLVHLAEGGKPPKLPGKFGSAAKFATEAAKKFNFDKFKMSEVYPDVIPPVMATDAKTGKQFLQKQLSPEAIEVQKARKLAQKQIDLGNYEPFFDIEKRFYADPSRYQLAGTTLTDIVPKKADTIAKYEQLANQPESLLRLRGAFDVAKDRPLAKDWYAMGQLENEFIRELGPIEGPKQFRARFADAMAATTGGADPNSNLMMAAFTNYQKGLGKEIPTTAADLPFPIGGRFVSGNMEQAKKLQDLGLIPVTNPKRHNFSANFLGYRDRSTLDEQMSQLWDPKMMAPPPNAYGIYEQALAKEARRAGVEPANFQDIAWAGAKNYPGKPMIREINEMLARTNMITGEPQEQILKGFIRGNKPMYGIAGAGAGVSLGEEEKASGGLVGYAEGGSTTPAWQRKEGKSPSGGLNALGRASYKRETGGELKAPQPEGGSRKKSFCARMGGMKKKLTSSKTANDPDSRINKALRKWKC